MCLIRVQEEINAETKIAYYLQKNFHEIQDYDGTNRAEKFMLLFKECASRTRVITYALSTKITTSPKASRYFERTSHHSEGPEKFHKN